MSAVFLVAYYWLGIVSSWYGRSSKTLFVERPLMLHNAKIATVLKLLSWVWTAAFLYLLFFVDWKVALASFVINFVSSYIRFVEDIALYPLAWLAMIDSKH